MYFKPGSVLFIAVFGLKKSHQYFFTLLINCLSIVLYCSPNNRTVELHQQQIDTFLLIFDNSP